MDSGLSQAELEQNVIYAVVWSFGGFLNHQNKVSFDHWWRSTFNQMNPGLCFPEPGHVWDYYTKPGAKGFLPWRENVPKYTQPDGNATSFVPNVRAAAVQHFFDQLIRRGISVLLAGPRGSGKTSLLQKLLNSRYNSKTSDTSLLHIYTNHFTSAKVVWDQIVECLEWDWGRRYTPKGCKKLISFIDDLHNTEV